MCFIFISNNLIYSKSNYHKSNINNQSKANLIEENPALIPIIVLGIKIIYDLIKDATKKPCKEDKDKDGICDNEDDCILN